MTVSQLAPCKMRTTTLRMSRNKTAKLTYIFHFTNDHGQRR